MLELPGVGAARHLFTFFALDRKETKDQDRQQRSAASVGPTPPYV
jgi:hypothetical protein